MNDPQPEPARSSSSRPEPSSVTLHSTWRGIVLSALGSLAVLAIGLFAVLRGGWGVVSTGVVLTGLAFAAVSLLDYPVASTFDSEGVTRRMALRRHRMPWSSIDQLSRTRPSAVKNFRKLAHGGLVAVRGRRRYLLVDQCESLAEFRAVEAVAVHDGDALAEAVPTPPDGMAPTWIHRRAKWAPTSGVDR